MLNFRPHQYQSYTVDFIKRHPTAALLLDMGLGKTVTTLTALNDLMLDSFEVGRVLIVAPLRVARDTWPDELQKWSHLQNITYAVAVGTSKQRSDAIESNKMLTIVNRENVPWLVEHYKCYWDTLVIDELSSFKSNTSKRFKALLKYRPYFKRVIGLTGTPAPNSLIDLWAQFRLIDQGERLYKYITHFRHEFCDARYESFGCTYSLRSGASDAIYKRISDITVSMQAVDYLDMPKLLSLSTVVKLSNEERLIYDQLKHDYVFPNITGTGEDIVAVNAASLSGKLCQLSNGAIYDESHNIIKCHDRKLEALEDLIESSGDDPVLIAYWFQHDAVRIHERFKNVHELKSSQDVSNWNRGKYKLALIHPASAGHGLNLQQGGHILIWFGLTWSLELYQQTNARLYRQGQTSKTVIIQHIVTEDTMDERILHALEKKDVSQSRLISAVRANL